VGLVGGSHPSGRRAVQTRRRDGWLTRGYGQAEGDPGNAGLRVAVLDEAAFTESGEAAR